MQLAEFISKLVQSEKGRWYDRAGKAAAQRAIDDAIAKNKREVITSAAGSSTPILEAIGVIFAFACAVESIVNLGSATLNQFKTDDKLSEAERLALIRSKLSKEENNAISDKSIVLVVSEYKRLEKL